jgi:hypothetical protein
VRQVVIEVRSAHCKPLYAGQETCDDAVAQMGALGFDLSSRTACPRPTDACERDVFFSSRAHPPEHPAAQAELSLAAVRSAAAGTAAGGGRQHQHRHVAGGCTKETPRGCCSRHPEHPNCKR